MVCFQLDKQELFFCSRVSLFFFFFQPSGFVVWCLHRDRNRGEKHDLKKCQRHKGRGMKPEEGCSIRVSVSLCEHVAGQPVNRK